MISTFNTFVFTVLSLLSLALFNDYAVYYGIALISFSPGVIFFLLSIRGRRYFDIFSPLFALPAAFGLVYGLGAIRYINENDTYSSELVVYPTLGLFTYFIAVIFSSKIRLNISPFFLRNYGILPAKLALYISVLICLVAAVIMVSKVGMPFLYEDKLDARLDARAIVSSNIIYLIRVGFLGFYIYLASAMHYKNLHTINWPYMGSLFILISFLNFIPGWRGPIFLFLLTCIIIYHYQFSKINPKKAIFFGFMLVIIMLAWGFIRIMTHPDAIGILENYEEMTSSPLGVFLIWSTYQFSVYTLGFRTILDLFSLGGNSFMYGGVFGLTLSTLKPGKQETLGEVIKDEANLQFSGAGLNPTILGDAYADAGMIGIVIYMSIIGFIVGRLYKIIKLTNSVTSVVFYAYITTMLILSVFTGVLSQASYAFHLIILFTIFILMGLLRKKNAGNL